jgi:hypothetical protein
MKKLSLGILAVLALGLLASPAFTEEAQPVAPVVPIDLSALIAVPAPEAPVEPVAFELPLPGMTPAAQEKGCNWTPTDTCCGAGRRVETSHTCGTRCAVGPC